MRHQLGAEDRVSRSQLEELLADLKQEGAVEHHEPFVLLLVIVKRRTADGITEGVEDAERPAGIGRGDLAIETSVEEAGGIVVAVASVRDHACDALHIHRFRPRLAWNMHSRKEA